MTTVSRELARHVADNPDGCDISELEALMDFIGEGDRPAPMAASLWPNKEVEAIEGYTHTTDNPMCRINVAVLIRDYCRRSIKARTFRSEGKIDRALNLEAINDDLHKRLPEWARW